jgi:hypothetical protein
VEAVKWVMVLRRALRVVRGYLEDSERADANVDKEWESKHQSGLMGLFVGWAEAHVRWRWKAAWLVIVRCVLHSSKLYKISHTTFSRWIIIGPS